MFALPVEIRLLLVVLVEEVMVVKLVVAVIVLLSSLSNPVYATAFSARQDYYIAEQTRKIDALIFFRPSLTTSVLVS